MGFQKFKSLSFCVGGRHRSATTNIYGDIPSKVTEVPIGYCWIRNREKSMTVSDNTLLAQGLDDGFRNVGEKWLNSSKKMAKDVLKNPPRALDNSANVASSITSKNPKAALSTSTDVISFY